jgi:hypothetical protein
MAHHNLIYFNDVDQGGHSTALGKANPFAAEARTAFSSPR